MQAVGRSGRGREEVRRQFRENPGIIGRTTRPDYGRAIAMSRSPALRSMLLPGPRAIDFPIMSGSSARRCSGIVIARWSRPLLAIAMTAGGGAGTSEEVGSRTARPADKAPPSTTPRSRATRVGDPPRTPPVCDQPLIQDREHRSILIIVIISLPRLRPKDNRGGAYSPLMPQAGRQQQDSSESRGARSLRDASNGNGGAVDILPIGLTASIALG